MSDQNQPTPSESQSTPTSAPNRPFRPPHLVFTFHFVIPEDHGTFPPPGMPRRRGLRPLGHRRPSQFMDTILSSALDIAALAADQWLRSQGEHLQGQPPASEKAIQDLQVIPILSEKRRQKHKLCAICQEDFLSRDCIEAHQDRKKKAQEENTCLSKEDEELNTEAIVRMPCHHLFHQSCINKWLETSATCPSCRYEIETDNEDYNRVIKERRKERDSQLEDEMDTDDEDCEVVEGSFVAPRGRKRKRTDDDTDVQDSKKPKEQSSEKSPVEKDTVEEKQDSSEKDTGPGPLSESTETSAPEEQQRRGIMDAIFPFLL